MVLRTLVLVVFVAAALVYVQQNHVLQNAGLLGYCTSIPTPKGQTGYWHECRPGKLTGTPQLSIQSCTRANTMGEVEHWRCPTALESNSTRQ
jgi:hypothetical protein